MLQYGQMAVDGIQRITEIHYKDPRTNTMVAGNFGIAMPGHNNSETGDFVQPNMIIYLDNTIGYLRTTIEIPQANVLYNIEGSTIPYHTVYLSYYPENVDSEAEITPLDMKKNCISINNIILSTTSDKEGSFSFKSISGISGKILVWTMLENYSSSTQTAIHAIATPGAEDIDLQGYFIYKTLMIKKHRNCSKCNGTGVSSITENEVTTTSSCSQCSGSGIAPLGKMFYMLYGDAPEEENSQTYNIQLSTLPTNCQCPTCLGAGEVINDIFSDCPRCNGLGTFTLTDNTFQDCAYCGGSGQINNYDTCPTCGGLGTNFENNTPSVEQLKLLTKRSEEIDGGTLQITLDSSKNRDADGNEISGRNYGFTWDKLNSIGNVDSRVLIWTYADQENDTLTLSEGAHQIEEGTEAAPCLAAGTKITMSDGSFKNIEDVMVGDYVLDKNSNPTKVYAINSRRSWPNHTLYYFEDDIIIDEVNKHRFFNVDQGFYQLLKNWSIGDHALHQSGKSLKLIKKELIKEEKIMYSIYTSAGNYYANQLLSGQAICNKAFIPEMTIKKAIAMLQSIDDNSIIEKWLNKGEEAIL